MKTERSILKHATLLTLVGSILILANACRHRTTSNLQESENVEFGATWLERKLQTPLTHLEAEIGSIRSSIPVESTPVPENIARSVRALVERTYNWSVAVEGTVQAFIDGDLRVNGPVVSLDRVKAEHLKSSIGSIRENSVVAIQEEEWEVLVQRSRRFKSHIDRMYADLNSLHAMVSEWLEGVSTTPQPNASDLITGKICPPGAAQRCLLESEYRDWIGEESASYYFGQIKINRDPSGFVRTIETTRGVENYTYQCGELCIGGFNNLDRLELHGEWFARHSQRGYPQFYFALGSTPSNNTRGLLKPGRYKYAGTAPAQAAGCWLKVETFGTTPAEVTSFQFSVDGDCPALQNEHYFSKRKPIRAAIIRETDDQIEATNGATGEYTRMTARFGKDGSLVFVNNYLNPFFGQLSDWKYEGQ